MYMKSYTLLALLAATMIGTTGAVKLNSAGDAASLAGTEELAISDNQIVEALFEGAKDKVRDGTLGDLAAVAANGAAPGTGPLAEYAVDNYGVETLEAAETVLAGAEGFAGDVLDDLD